jgi:plastocyanin
MTRTLAVLAVFALVAAAAATARPSAKTLNGTVGPGYTISLKQNGKLVKNLKAGTYTFKVADKSSIHSFVLEKEKGSPKFEKEITDVSDTGTKTVTIKLTKGTYKYYCEPHESFMHGSFTVT